MTSEKNNCSDLASLEAAERRLADLERRLYGDQHKFGNNSDDASPMVSKLAGIANEVGDALGRRERITPLFRRLNELDKYLDPASWTEASLSIDSRAELILNEERRIRHNNALLEKVKEKKVFLDSETLKNVPSLESKLVQLTKLHLDQNERGDQWAEDSLGLIEQYNDVVDAITSTFIEYDKVLTAAEELSQHQTKK
jgi:hypothetical protein